MSYFSHLAAVHGACLARLPRYILSDEDMKTVRDNTDPRELVLEILENGPPYSERELEIIVEAAGNMDNDHDFEKDGDSWRDDVLDGYAKHIHNYAYTYKPEAKAVDPSIDPEQEHIGPMAQDIEKVNPAAIIETEDGVKTVDTGRLALMNAGAIAELARQLKELQHG